MNFSVVRQNPDGTSEVIDKSHPDYRNAENILRRHFGMPEISHEGSTETPPSPDHSPVFWVALAKETPPLPPNAKCLLNCGEEILRGEYRIAVAPRHQKHLENHVPEYYHVRCFEKTVDLSQADVFDRILPLSPRIASSWHIRTDGLKDENSVLDIGAERLIIQWKSTISRLINERDGVQNESLDPVLNDLLQKAGSSKYEPKPARMCDYEFKLSTNIFAPIESDGPEDSEEWNLYEKYLSVRDDDQEGLKERHSLSQMLEAWRSDKILATSKVLAVEDEKLSPKAIRAIKRLSTSLDAL